MIINNLSHHLLIASPSVIDNHFYRTVIYINKHNKDEIRGIIINKPLQVTLDDILKHLKLPTNTADKHQPVLLGGPICQENGFIVSEQKNTANTEHQLSVSSSHKTLKTLLRHQTQSFFIAMGYCCWSTKQFNQDMTNNFWLVAPFNKTLLFDAPVDTRWQKAIESLGININQLTDWTGHA